MARMTKAVVTKLYCHGNRLIRNRLIWKIEDGEKMLCRIVFERKLWRIR